ncbi:MAG: TerB family tellurite resistance protein [Sphaerochaetaceae bacterium]|nr:TerB family tellurite resistance protein [Sphaerochaetaceae bacterium]
MAWLGKIIGGTMGFFLGGPLGMIAGIAFGNLFDSSNVHNESERPSSFSSIDQTQMVFFVGAFSMLARMVTSDGSMVTSERQKVEEFISRDLKLGPDGRNAALRVFNAALSNNAGTFDQFALQFYQNFSHEKALLELMMDVLVRVAAADGTISDPERKLIDSAARIFRISDSLLASIIKRYSSVSASPVKAYSVLNLTPDASVEEIKKAYRKLSIEFHPDTVASKGLPEEFTRFATEKFRAIQEAYETIKTERGIK